MIAVANSARLCARTAGRFGAWPYIALLLLAFHVLAVNEGTHWTSPLLIGDRLFDLGFAMAMLWYAWAVGRRVARPLLVESGDALDEGLVALAMGLGVISLGIFFAGLLHLYYTFVFLAAVVALSFWLRDDLKQIPADMQAVALAWRRARSSIRPTFGEFLTLAMLLPTLALVLIRAMTPVAGDASAPEWDSTVYHLAAPKAYILAHHFMPRPDIPLANAPSGGDMLQIPGLLVGTDTAGRMLNVLLVLLIGLAVYAFGRRHFSRQVGWLAALMLFATGWVIQLVPSTGPDFVAALLLLVGASDLLAWATEVAARRESATPGSLDRGRPARWPGSSLTYRCDRLLLRSGVLIGFGVSCKLTDLPFILAGCATAAAVCLLLRGQGILANLVGAVRAVMLFGLATLLPLGPWLLKNICYFGNPFYPSNVAPTPTISSATDHLLGPTTQFVSTQPTLLGHAWWIVTTLCSTYWFYATPLSVLILVAPLVLRTPAGRAGWVLVLTGALAWIIFVPVFPPPRYWIPLIAVGNVVAAATVIAAIERLRTRRVALIAFGALAVNGAAWLAANAWDQSSVAAFAVIVPAAYAALIWFFVRTGPRHFTAGLVAPVTAYICLAALLGLALEVRMMSVSGTWDAARGALSRSDFLARHSLASPAEEWVNANTPSGATIVLVHVTPGYFLDRTYLDDWYGDRFAILEARASSRAAEIASWCRAGVTYAVFNRGPEEPWDDRHVYPLHHFAWTTMPGIDAKPLFSANGIDVLSVHPCEAAGVTPPRGQ